jgi:glucokinase
MTHQKKLIVGIDIGGTNTVAGIINADGSILFRTMCKTNESESLNALLSNVYANLQPELQRQGMDSFLGVGIGAPDVNCYAGTIEHAVNLKWKGILPLAKEASKVFNLPVRTMNDANAAALGEMYFGAGKKLNDFILLTLGTGVGSGVISGRKLVLGQRGLASKLGHTIIIPNGRFHSGSGLYGSLEMYCSAEGIMQTTNEILKDFSGTTLLQLIPSEKMSPKHVTEAALKGDTAALQILHTTGTILGKALANFVHFSGPEAIILFGGITGAGNLLLDPAYQSMNENVLEVFKNNVPLKISELNGADAAILGAASLFMYTHNDVNAT